nr:MBG domain-containing protein [uncultured Butyrivibrio sp.]
MKANRNIQMRIMTAALCGCLAATSNMPVYADIDTSGGQQGVGVTFTITPRDMGLDTTKSAVLDADSLKDITATYDGDSRHSYEPDEVRAVVTGLRTGENPADIAVKYSIDNGMTWTDVVPSITNAGIQPVKIKLSMDTYNDLIIDTNIVINKRDAAISFDSPVYNLVKEDWNGANTDLTDLYDHVTMSGFVVEPTIGTDFEIKPDTTVITDPISTATEYNDGLVITYPKAGSAYNFANYNVTTDTAAVYFLSYKMGVLERDLSVSSHRKEYDGVEEDGITFEARSDEAAQYLREATIEFSVDGGAWTTSVPKIKNVGDNSVITRITISGETLVWGAGVPQTIGVWAKSLILVPDSVTVEESETAPSTYTYKTYTSNMAGDEFEDGAADGETLTATFANSHQGETGTGTWDGAIVISGTATVADGSGTDTTSNYTFTYRTATYKRINTKYEALKNSMAVTPYNHAYDGASHDAVTVTGDYIEEATVTYSTDGGTTWTATKPSVKDVADSGQVQVKAVMGSQEPIIKTVNAVVSQKSVTVAANKAEKEEDATTYPTYKATVTGVVTGQIYTYTITNTKESEMAVNKYTGAIVVSDLVVKDAGGNTTTSNYNIRYVAGDYEITNGEFKDLQAKFKVTGYTGTYDGKSHGLTISGTTEHTNLIYSTDAGNVWVTEAPTVKDVEDSTTVYVRAYVGTDTTKYVTKKVNLKVSKRSAKITVNAASKKQGEKDPDFSATVSGIVAGESFKYHIERTDDSDSVGTHTIKAVLDEEYPNYQITLKSAYLTIKQSDSSKNVSTIRVSGYSGPYDGTAHTVDVNIASTDGIRIEYSTDGGSSWSESKPYITDVADSTSVQVRASDGTTSKTVSTAIQIKRAKATVTVEDVTINLGESLPEFTATADGLIGADTLDYTIEADPVSKAGTYRNYIKLTLNREYPNYQITIKNGTLTVLKDGAPTIDDFGNDDLSDRRGNINLISDGYTLIDEPEEEIIMIAKFDAVEDTAFDEKTSTTKPADDKQPIDDKKPTKAGDAAPYIIGAIVTGAIAVGMGVTGGFSALWLLLLGLLFKKKRKHWNGLLTYTSNWAVKVKGTTDGVEDMQDILNKGVTVDELRTLMADSGVETILPANTKMSIDIEGVENEFEADEEVFYNELAGKSGHAIVTFFNGAAKLSFTVTMDLH